jgi:hypothetical protein
MALMVEWADQMVTPRRMAEQMRERVRVGRRVRGKGMTITEASMRK